MAITAHTLKTRKTVRIHFHCFGCKIGTGCPVTLIQVTESKMYKNFKAFQRNVHKDSVSFMQERPVQNNKGAIEES